MNTVDFIERHRGVQLICHAIRHLLDHPADEMDAGDVKAIDILQFAINPEESHPQSRDQFHRQFAQSSLWPIPSAAEAIVQACNSDEPDLADAIVDEIAPDCAPVEPARHPVSLLSLLELLLHAVRHRVWGHRVSSTSHESPVGCAR